jgi:3'-5' exoribonuclease
VWEIPRYVLEEKDLANTIIGPIQPIETTKAHILEEIETIENEFLHRLLENLLINGPYQDSFFIAPGAKTIHHNYAGGLAEHTLYVLLGSKALAQVYTQLPINNDLLKTGAILHDIGKVDCYALSSDGINTTKKMELFDHIVLGISIINRVGQPLVQSPADEDLLDQVVHIIASHHALPEWGSPKEPATNEAWIIHVNDLVSARLAKTK